MVGKRTRRIRKGRLFLIILVFGLTAAGLIWFAVGGVRSLLLRQTADIQSLHPGKTIQQVTVEGVIIKKEHLVPAQYSGSVTFSVADGQRVKAGTALGKISASALDAATGVKDYAIRATASGVICTHMDGLETVLTPASLESIEIPPLDKIENKESQEPGLVEKGQPIAKIVDNLAPVYIHSQLSMDLIDKLEANVKSPIAMEWQDYTLEAFLHKAKRGSQPGVILVLKKYPDELVHRRLLVMNLTTETLEGLLVPEKSLVIKEGQEGIYQVWKGLVRWVPVEVSGRLNEQAAIKGKEIQQGIRYVGNPAFAREGDRL